MRIRKNLVEQDDSGHDVITESSNSVHNDSLAAIQTASTQNKIALESRKGQNDRRLIEFAAYGLPIWRAISAF